MTELQPLITEKLDAKGMQSNRKEILDVYELVYRDQLADPFFSVARYWERLEAYSARAGFSLVTGRVANALVGYTLGYTLPKGSTWWQGLKSNIPSALTDENGHRTFALNEIMVLAEHRRKGYARKLHDNIISDRPEPRATLLVLPDNIPARAAYASWGWRQIGPLQPFDDAPVYDSFILDLDRDGPHSDESA